MELNFRTLTADEIDIRVGSKAKDNTWISLLLYKNARVDMDILDETVGKTNWKRSHTRDNANCIVSIYDEEKKDWVSKEDTGTESNSEKEKGQASDSFKRACINWGIGRELYTSPQIFIKGSADTLKKDSYSVKEIDYDANRRIVKLSIVDKTGSIVFSYPKSIQNETRQITKEQTIRIHTLIGKNEALKKAIYKKFNISSSVELTQEQAKKMIETLEAGIEKKKKEVANQNNK